MRETFTHQWSGLVLQDLVDLRQDVRRELRQDLDSLEVFDDLLRLRSAENDRGGVGVARNPSEGEGSSGGPQSCKPCELHLHAYLSYEYTLSAIAVTFLTFSILA